MTIEEERDYPLGVTFENIKEKEEEISEVGKNLRTMISNELKAGRDKDKVIYQKFNPMVISKSELYDILYGMEFSDFLKGERDNHEGQFAFEKQRLSDIRKHKKFETWGFGQSLSKKDGLTKGVREMRKKEALRKEILSIKRWLGKKRSEISIYTKEMEGLLRIAEKKKVIKIDTIKEIKNRVMKRERDAAREDVNIRKTVLEQIDDWEKLEKAKAPYTFLTSPEVIERINSLGGERKKWI